MKFHLIVIMLSALIFSYSCKKEDRIDERKQYVGKYHTIRTSESYGAIAGAYSEDTMMVSVSYGDTDSTIRVLSHHVKLDEKGEFWGGDFFIRIGEDHLLVSESWGGIGGGAITRYQGNRVSTTP